MNVLEVKTVEICHAHTRNMQSYQPTHTPSLWPNNHINRDG